MHGTLSSSQLRGRLLSSNGGRCDVSVTNTTAEMQAMKMETPVYFCASSAVHSMRLVGLDMGCVQQSKVSDEGVLNCATPPGQAPSR